MARPTNVRFILEAVVAVVVAGGVFAGVASATSIPLGGGGVLQLSNMTGVLVGVTNTCINWAYPAVCSAATSVQDSVSGSDAAVFTPGSTPQDTIKDLPAGVATPLVDFMTVQSPLAGGIVNFDLESIVIPGAFGDCTSGAVNSTCNPGGGSPFDLFQATANQVTVTFSMDEIAYTGTSASGSTPYVSIFTTQLSGTLPNGMTDTIPNILNYVAGGGAVTATWSGTQSPVPGTTTPEPGTIFLVGSGLIGLGAIGRRRFRRG
jgi:PEP-CTERM motif